MLGLYIYKWRYHMCFYQKDILLWEQKVENVIMKYLKRRWLNAKKRISIWKSNSKICDYVEAIGGHAHKIMQKDYKMEHT